MNEIVTTDLSKYGYRELAEAGKLLLAYAENGCDFLNDGITLNFNMNSGNVFLTDEDMNVAMESEGKLYQFFSCPNCGYENSQEDALNDKKNFIQYEGFCSLKCLKA